MTYLRARTPVLLSLCLFLTFAAAMIGNPSPLNAQETLEVDFRLDWKKGAQHSPFFIAKEMGWFADKGLNVNIIGGSGSSDALKQLGAGQLEFALIDAPVILQGINKGMNIYTLGAYYQETPVSIMWDKDRVTVRTPSDLSGKRVGVKKASSTYQGLRLFLTANGMSLDDIQQVPIGFGVRPLLADRVDAMLGFTMNEPLTAQREGVNVGEMMISDHGVQLYGLTLATRQEIYDQHPEKITAFVRAVRRGVTFMHNNPDRTIEILQKRVPDINPEHERGVLEKILDTGITESSEGYITHTAAGWASTINLVHRLGLIDQKIPVYRVY